MSRLIAYFLVFAIGAASAVALVSCGGESNADLLPGDTAQQISENLDQVEQLVSGGDCVGAEDATREVSDQIAALGGVDRELKQALREGAGRLDEVVVANCTPETTEAISPASVPETTESTTTEATKEKPPKKSPTVETNTTPTTPTTPTTTPTTPTTPTTTPTTPTTESGGTGPPVGGVDPDAGSGSE